ncbi:hypothetical protein P8452_57633 [Trifolium repens]|nr:hypothetical protein P8452_57633 [Trifolium repens]
MTLFKIGLINNGKWVTFSKKNSKALVLISIRLSSTSTSALVPLVAVIALSPGEMLSATLNIVGFSWITSPDATEFESIVLDWHTKALLLPQYFLSNVWS